MNKRKTTNTKEQIIYETEREISGGESNQGSPHNYDSNVVDFEKHFNHNVTEKTFDKDKTISNGVTNDDVVDNTNNTTVTPSSPMPQKAVASSNQGQNDKKENATINPNLPMMGGGSANLNGGITVHSDIVSRNEQNKIQKKKKISLIIIVIGLVGLLITLIALLFGSGLIKLPQTIDKKYASYSYNYLVDDVKFYYDKVSEIYLSKNDEHITISSVDDNCYIEIYDYNGILNVVNKFGTLNKNGHKSEKHGNLSVEETIYSGSNSDGVEWTIYDKIIDNGNDAIEVIYCVRKQANTSDYLSTFNNIYTTAIKK